MAATTYDKIIVTNFSALTAKYKAEGVALIRQALSKLIAADNKRGLNTQVVELDNAQDIAKVSGKPVTDATNPRQNKNTIDIVFRGYTPAYLMILGAIDVVPHQDLKNPVYSPPPEGDLDEYAYGDIPYACETSYSQNPSDFLAPTRAVGRLPDVTGGDNPRDVVRLLESAARSKSLRPDEYRDYFAVSAQVFEKSTQLSLSKIFGSFGKLKVVPPSNASWSPAELGRLAHFFNCHGALASPQFSGQPASGRKVYPVALDASQLVGKISEGTVVAAECCYGAELYDPSGIGLSICNTYFVGKAYGFFGSTTIAYGPSDKNEKADLMCQYFFESLLAGASLGRAALEARQKFALSKPPLDPFDVKTMAQFNLYGDPSITPIEPAKAQIAPQAKRAAIFLDRFERGERRLNLFNFSAGLGGTVPRLSPSERGPSKSIENAMRATARDLKMSAGQTLSFTVSRQMPRSKSLASKLFQAVPSTTAFHVMFMSPPQPKVLGLLREVTEPPKIVSIAALIAKESDGELVSMSAVYSR
jgi:hypothetical protein